MQSQKPRDREKLSPLEKAKNGKPVVSSELRAVSQRRGPEGSHGGGDDCRSLNPPGLDEPSGDGGRSSPKRRSSHLPSHGARDGWVDSRLATSGHVKRRPSNDKVKQREVESGEFIGDSDGDTDDSRPMHGQSNDYATRRLIEGRDSSQSKNLTSAREYAMVDRKDGVVREPYCEICAMERQSTLQDSDMRWYESERYRCQDRIHFNKLEHLKPHQQSDARFNPRAVARAALPAAYSKESSFHNDFGRSSGNHSRRELIYSHGVREPSKPTNKNSERQKYPETSYGGANYQRMLIDSGRESDMGLRNMHIPRKRAYDTLRDERENYFDVKPQRLAHEIDNLHETIPIHNQVNDQVQYSHGEINDHARKVTGPSIARSVDNDEENADDYRNFERRSAWNHATMEESTVPKSFKGSDVSHQDWTRSDYGSTHTIHKSRTSQESAFLRIGAKQANQISEVRPRYDIRRNDDSLNPKEIYFDDSMSKYDRGMHRAAARVKRLKVEEGCSYEPYNRIPKRRMYDIEEEFGDYAHRGSMPANRNLCEFEDLDNSEELVGQDYRTELYSPSGVTYNSDEERSSEMAYYRQKYHQDDFSDGCWSYQNGLEHQQEDPVRLSEHGQRYLKGYHKSQPLKQYKSQHFGYKKRFHKNQRIRKTYDESNEGQHSNDGDGLEEPESAVVSEFPEESEEFEKSVHDAFLIYSKKLNTNSRVQRRYLAQGKAGSLFCVVCGRSSSKEFQGTQNLAKHALMSRKVGLRAQHLGLHRAICVLLGWSLVTADPINWVPEPLPDDIALTQKEDLILWPPLVVIHNISMAVDDPKDQRVIPRERIETFLRGKGFAEGKMVVCLGKPADQSVIVVKFLNTFSGLGNAGKLHEYFAENKRGRVEFEKRTTDHGEGNKNEAPGMQGNDEDETLLYGYMGIAEDLDKIDYYAKKTSWVKSKKEIYDLANAPVKSKES